MQDTENIPAESNEPNTPEIPELTDDEKIKAFRSMLEEHAGENNLKITDIKGWTEPKIEWMALNDHKCCCSPNDRVCPCDEGRIEVRTKPDHMCLCSIFKNWRG